MISINTASQSLLETLPGIGAVRAGAIIQSRTVDGPFGAVEDLLSRELVPASVFEDIAPMITVY
ncbi:MAG: helix-hairpin-helix domain-containing protein [Chloroflexi bacterium]|nr:helix-hairpin-helix domain-containing protein [Chloroflexota bacterium]